MKYFRIAAARLIAAIQFGKPPQLIYLISAAWAATWLPTDFDMISKVALADTAPSEINSGIPNLQLVRELRSPGPITGLTWSSDGTKIAASSKYPNANMYGTQLPSPFGKLITIWDSQGRVVQQLNREKPFLVDGNTFVFVAGDKKIVAPSLLSYTTTMFSVFDIDTGEVAQEIPGQYAKKGSGDNRAALLAVSPDQTLLAVAYLNRQAALFSTKDWSKLGDLPDPSASRGLGPLALSFSKDGKLIAVGTARIALIYELASMKVVHRIDAFPDGTYTSSVAFSPDGGMLASGMPLSPNRPVRVFDVKTGSLVAAYSEKVRLTSAVSWSSDGRAVAFTTDYNTLHLWSPFDQQLNERKIPLGNNVRFLAFSPDGKTLAVGTNTSIKIFNVTK